MIELTVERRAEAVLKECRRRGLVIKLDTIEKKRGGARHLHLGFAGLPGVLEITDLGTSVLLKVADRRDGGWASQFAHELAGPQRRPRRRTAR